MKGLIVYEGPSRINGAPIVVILTAIKGSSNSKTGHLVQSYILRADVDPVTAAKLGQDSAICGQCEHRPKLAKKTCRAPCYVNLGRAPLQVFNAYHRGSYNRATPDEAAAIIAGLKLRLGTYGDPAAAPVGLWETLTQYTAGHTGYSHQWQRRGFDVERWKGLVMASADNLDAAALANLMGLRVFRVTTANDKQTGETTCPASAEGGRRTQCADCLLCAGTTKAARDIVIKDHARGHARRVITLETIK
jgi:hypothetical protein